MCVHWNVTLPEGIIMCGSNCDAPSSAFNCSYCHLGNPGNTFGASCWGVSTCPKNCSRMKNNDMLFESFWNMLKPQSNFASWWFQPIPTSISTRPSMSIGCASSFLKKFSSWKRWGFKVTDAFGRWFWTINILIQRKLHHGFYPLFLKLPSLAKNRTSSLAPWRPSCQMPAAKPPGESHGSSSTRHSVTRQSRQMWMQGGKPQRNRNIPGEA